MSPTFSERVLNSFGRVLRKAREQSGYGTAEKFANTIGVEPHTYRKYERGEANPTLETITRICIALKITPNELFPEAAPARPLQEPQSSDSSPETIPPEKARN